MKTLLAINALGYDEARSLNDKMTGFLFSL